MNTEVKIKIKEISGMNSVIGTLNFSNISKFIGIPIEQCWTYSIEKYDLEFKFAEENMINVLDKLKSWCEKNKSYCKLYLSCRDRPKLMSEKFKIGKTCYHFTGYIGPVEMAKEYIDYKIQDLQKIIEDRI